MRANLYIGVLIGVLIFVAIMWYQNRGKVEGFEDAGAGTGTGAGAGEASANTTPAVPTSFEAILAALNADPTNYKYVEKKENIPGKDHLKLYYSCFSDKTLANEDTYLPSMQRWNNHLAADQAANLVNNAASIPVSIKPPYGLPMDNVTMNSIYARELNPSSPFNLNSFSVSFYVRFKTITFIGTNPIEIFRIPMEHPNVAASMELRPVQKEDGSIDPDNIDIELHLGDYRSKERIYTRKSKDFLTSGNYILFTYVYDNTDTNSKLYLYIGSNEQDNYNAQITPKPTLVLGNSRISINSGATLDMNLQAFAFYDSKLSFDTHKELITYFTEQQSGVASILEALKVMSTAQIAAVQNYVQDQTVTLEDLQKQLEECQATPKKEEEKKFKYGIPLPEGAEGVSETDLESCSILGVKKRGEKALPQVTTPASVAAESATVATTTAATPTQNRFAINIPFLKDILPKNFTTE